MSMDENICRCWKMCDCFRMCCVYNKLQLKEVYSVLDSAWNISYRKLYGIHQHHTISYCVRMRSWLSSKQFILNVCIVTYFVLNWSVRLTTLQSNGWCICWSMKLEGWKVIEINIDTFAYKAHLFQLNTKIFALNFELVFSRAPSHHWMSFCKEFGILPFYWLSRRTIRHTIIDVCCAE